MSGMDRLTELLPCPFCGGEADTMTPEADDMRAATVMCMGCYCTGKECETEAQAIAAWNRRASQAAPSDRIDAQSVSDAVEGGGGNWVPCTGCHELNEGYTTGPYSPVLKCHLGGGCRECGGIGAIWDTTDYAEMGDWLAAQEAAPAPSDGLREAAATILAVLQDPDSLPIEKHPDWQAIYNAMTADHSQSMEICGIHDWPSILIAGLEVMAQDSADLTPAPAQEGGRT